MQAIEFDTTIKDGMIRIPSNYMKGMTDKVRVIVLSKENSTKKSKEETSNAIDSFFEAAGIWKDRNDINPKELRENGWKKRMAK
ncbi:MAG: hypothetical protein SFY32_02200 [Bacteroidota bacterium]|nr:hypothetical protein [Bacteroidota bacterium]